ncbi:ankyrin repeat domain protein [Nitzschia inconspicua]|uniref:Ankyrin repeat domain protein n=1 Tax=Nitzschia inconspicua TaxID=303405 RepID=A0A9K3LBH7_9STRA|nr:ankyrin repeat domain protein [Nitzschia inconspicua]
MTTINDHQQSVLDLAVQQEWTLAVHRARHFPYEITLRRDFDGANALHVACDSNAPLHFFRQLFQIHQRNVQKALSSVDDIRGATPLLVACGNQISWQTIDFLLEVTPKGAIQTCDKDGWSALHFLACWPVSSWRTSHNNQQADDAAIPSSTNPFVPLARKLMQMDGDMATRPNNVGYCPLRLFVSTHQFELQYSYHFASQSSTNESFNQELWRVVLTLIGVHESDDDPFIIHKCLDIPHCPVLVTMLACRLHPKLLLQVDDEGNTPLHVAVRNKQPFLIQYLLNMEPAAARHADIQGRTPFCVARKTTYSLQWHDQVHGQLLHAYPTAIFRTELSHFLHPKILERILTVDQSSKASLCSGNSSERTTTTLYKRCSISTVFEMLRSYPWR